MLDANPEADTPQSDEAPKMRMMASFNGSGDLNLTRRSMREELLDRETEFELARRWLEEECYDSRARLINAHSRISARLVASMKRGKQSENDLLQEAAFGLMRATDKFDLTKGFRFSTYATFWVRAAIQNAVMRDNSAVRLKSSSSNRTAFYTLPHIEASAEKKLRKQGITPTREEIHCEAARVMNIDSDRLHEIRKAIPSSTSLNEPMSLKPGGGESFGERIDLLVCEKPTSEELLIDTDSRSFASDAIKSALDELTAREVRIITSRKMSDEPLTLEVLSIEFGITRERVRQIEAGCLVKLRAKMKRFGIRNLDFLNT